MQCNKCHHFCQIADNQTGLCGVRQSKEGKIKLLTYGKAAAVNVDPIEKKPLFHFLPNSLAFSFGTLGCNFICANCQNFELAQMNGLKGKVAEYKKLDWGENIPPERIVELAIENNCDSIACTYNEPTVWIEYGLDAMKIARAKGLKTVWVSNGYMSDETLDDIIPHLDAINVDIKSSDENFYRKNCGANLLPVLRNCKRLVNSGVWVEITTLVIPSLSDNPEMLKRLADFIGSELGDTVPWHLSAFSPEIAWKLSGLTRTPLSTLKEAYTVARGAGLKNVYLGNVPSDTYDNTYCPKCNELVIEREGFISKNNLEGSSCPRCGQPIAGLFL
jgi:pyruvate formate lyase activating enzyme